MLFAVCSDRGAPGVTTLTLALAAARGLPSVVVEADPYGGDLALRCRIDGDPLPPTPTVLGLGAGISAAQVAQLVASHEERHAGNQGANRKLRRLDLWCEGSHQLTELVRVVPGFLTAEKGSSLAWESVAATAGSQVVPVFADLGRIHTGSPSMPIAAAADALIPVCRGEVSSVQHLIWRLEQLVPAIAERNGRTPVVVPIVVTTRRNGSHAAGQVAAVLAETTVSAAVRYVGALAWDPGAVALLVEGADPWAKPLRTSPLLKSARKVMWLLGLATSLDHADPYAAGKRARRAGRRQPEERQGPGRTNADPWAPAADADQPRTADEPSEAGTPGAEAPPPLTQALPPPRTPVAGTVNGHPAAAGPAAKGNGSAPSFKGLGRPWRSAGVKEGE